MDVGRYPLFEYPPYDLALAVRMHEVVLAHELDLLHVPLRHPARDERVDRARDARADAAGHHASSPRCTAPTSRSSARIRRSTPITKFSIEKSDGLTAVSRYLRTETLTTFGCTACRIEVIPNFIDPEVYDRSRYEPQSARAGAPSDARC